MNLLLLHWSCTRLDLLNHFFLDLLVFNIFEPVFAIFFVVVDKTTLQIWAGASNV